MLGFDERKKQYSIFSEVGFIFYDNATILYINGNLKLYVLLKFVSQSFSQFVFNLCEETISRTDEGQPRPKYIFNKCGTNIYFFTLRGLVNHHHRVCKCIAKLSHKHVD